MSECSHSKIKLIIVSPNYCEFECLECKRRLRMSILEMFDRYETTEKFGIYSLKEEKVLFT